MYLVRIILRTRRPKRSIITVFRHPGFINVPLLSRPWINPPSRSDGEKLAEPAAK